MSKKEEIEVLGKKVLAEPTDNPCQWITDGQSCSDNIYKVEMFSGTFCIPICTSHLEDHAVVVKLHHNGYDVEEVVKMSREQRDQELYTLNQSGSDNNDFNL